MWNIKTIFLEDSPKINMKDYIEVNSAIALAMQGLGYGVQNINFSKKKFLGESTRTTNSRYFNRKI